MQAIQIQVPLCQASRSSMPVSSSLVNLYERGKLSIGHAARAAGQTKRAFIAVMGKYGFSVFSSSNEDFQSDLKNAWKP